MNTLEEKLRAAFRETAEQKTQRDVLPLRLPMGRARSRQTRASRLRRWWAWLAPLTAAAAVAAVVAGSLAVSHALRGRRPAAGPAHRAARSQGPFAGLPPYYVALTGRAPRHGPPVMPLHAVIRATATGALLGRVRPPRPYGTFSAVTGGGGVFVLAANRWSPARIAGRIAGTNPTPTRFYLLRLGADGRPMPLTALPIPVEPAKADISMSLSADGSELAVALRGGVNGGPGPAIQIYNLATGSERVWTWQDGSPVNGSPITNNAGQGDGEVLSWSADGRMLAFQQWVGNSIDVRVLDTTTPGGNLRADSRLAVEWKGEAESARFVHGRSTTVIFGPSAILTPDGSRIIAATSSVTKRPLHSVLAFTEFSAATGKPVAALGRWLINGKYPGQTQDVLWSDPSGRKLIVLAHQPGRMPMLENSNVASYVIKFCVLSGGTLTPIPGAPQAGLYPWPAW